MNWEMTQRFATQGRSLTARAYPNLLELWNSEDTAAASGGANSDWKRAGGVQSLFVRSLIS